MQQTQPSRPPFSELQQAQPTGNLRPPTILEPPPNAIPTQPKPKAVAQQTQAKATRPIEATPSPRTAVMERQAERTSERASTSPRLGNEWQDWMQPAPATAEQVDQLLAILKPLPRSLITLKQMLDLAAKKGDRIETACTNSLMSLQSLNEYFQENQTTDTSLPTISLRQIEISLKQQQTIAEQTKSQILEAINTRTPTQPSSSWKEIGSRVGEGAAIALATWLLVQFSPIGLSHINTGINNLLIKFERLTGGKPS